MRLSEKPRVKMHHGMGVSTGDRRGNQNSAMQSGNGICDKIENYISDLGQWYVGDIVHKDSNDRYSKCNVPCAKG